VNCLPEEVIALSSGRSDEKIILAVFSSIDDRGLIFPCYCYKAPEKCPKNIQQNVHLSLSG
jgi:hypothetical protein